MKTIEREIYDKSDLFSYKLTMQALKILNSNSYRLCVVKSNVKKVKNKKIDIIGSNKLAKELKRATICPYKHAEIDRALADFKKI